MPDSVKDISSQDVLTLANTLDSISEKVLLAQSVVLSTHRRCDGDGLGAELAVFHALRKTGKLVRIVNLDRTPAKYDYLNASQYVEIYSPGALKGVDLVIIFDTNDSRLVEPLFSEALAQRTATVFIDHHPLLLQGPMPTAGSYVDILAASTGELGFELIRRLKIPLDPQIARALYTSIVFDTQLFRFVKSLGRSHSIAAELLNYESNPEEIHRHLFASYTVPKMMFLARALSQVEYVCDDQIAFSYIPLTDYKACRLEGEETSDVIDQVMNIAPVEIAALLREEESGGFKLSLRSKGRFDILTVAEKFGGGGHVISAGAHLLGDVQNLRSLVLEELTDILAQTQQVPNKGQL